MYKINENYLKLQGSYLFSTIGKKVAAYKEANPDRDVISLGIGDVTQPLAPAVIEALHKAVDEMAVAETFHGYAPDLGYEFLRSAIRENDYKARGVDIALDEIFISDGAKSDSGNIGDIFAENNRIAVCDPVYPVYVDTNVMAGRTGEFIRLLILHQRFQRKHLTLFIYVSLTTQQVQQLLRISYRNGLIMLTKLVQLLFTMLHMKHIFQKTTYLTQFMNVTVQRLVPLN